MRSHSIILETRKTGAAARVADVSLHVAGVAPRSNWSFLKLVMDDGRHGWGELTLRAHEGAMSAILTRLMPSIRNLTLDELATLCKAYPGMPAGRAGNAVISALDQASLDLAGQYLDLPICDLWGRADRTPLRSYATVNRSVSERTPAGFAQACKAAVGAGFQGIKIMPFDAVTPRTASSAEGVAEAARAVQRILAVRDAIGPDLPLMVDCHWRLDGDAARRFIDDLSDARLHWLECPVPESPEWHDSIRALRKHANHAGMRLAGAENIIGVAGALPFVAQGLYDVIMPDIKYCGGYGEFARIAALAAGHDIAVSPHNPSGPVAHAHTVHVCAALGITEAVEQQFAESPLFETGVRGNASVLRDGHFRASAEPGLGIVVDEAILDGHPPGDVALSLFDPSFA
ncbi:mandelate racemase/muconate lactonizing enzyme family protein [Achromobacter xylosoxidans]|uniref:mandelate racemase/muconate lactonizing enzyme family protein n=1 Tax=Alcaligenes xylosoxydans xylosoxydans TaxID=85698 RepID=UPI0029305B96|nr:mandelate racemase/muconate lactonizing enzyme family protein [Achromobacter xylosoxidans]WOB73153.1 mandelate racemase/muconate lactonizing enzyme family protein [Achromobacter xylosoxidans]